MNRAPFLIVPTELNIIINKAEFEVPQDFIATFIREFLVLAFIYAAELADLFSGLGLEIIELGIQSMFDITNLLYRFLFKIIQVFCEANMLL